MDDATEVGCVACLVMGIPDTPAEIHHIDGKTKPNAHFLTIPLCPSHHRYGLDGETVASRHPNKRKFETLYGTENDLRLRVCAAVGYDPVQWMD